MYLDVRKGKNGTVQYRFTYINDQGKRCRFPQAQVPRFDSREEAETWGNSQAALRETRKAHIAKKLSWRSKHYAFEELLARYTAYQKEHAPNSWQSCVYYLEHWVFPYYLQERKSGNVNDWWLGFEEFRDWLKSPEVMVKKGRKAPLAVSTQCNIIKALNTFLECLKRYNLIDKDSVRKCEAYPDHMLNHRGYKDVMLPGERDRLVAVLRTSYPPAADFLQVLWHTGMRFSELFGLPMSSLFKGAVRPGPLADALGKADMTDCHGYLYLESQPLHDDCRREADGSMLRKPLKTCKVISPKYARTIPVRDKTVWNILAVRFKAQQELLLQQKYGPSRTEYRLWEDAEWNRTVNGLREAYRHLGLVPKGYHACRHTFITYLVGQTGSYVLVRAISGHRSQKAFERYLHLFEQISIEAQQTAQEIDIIA